MDSNIRKRYEELKRKQKESTKKKRKNDNILLKECLESLQNAGHILSDEQEQYVLQRFTKEVPMTEWGRVDWKKINLCKRVNYYNELSKMLIEDEYYIIWGEGLPVVQCKLEYILKGIDDVVAVDFDTWLVSKDFLEIVEIYHEGEIKVGRLS